jgi:hypothetical protein
VALPPAFARTRLDGSRPGHGDWFQLSCRLEGVSGDFVGEPADETATIGIRVPRAS